LHLGAANQHAELVLDFDLVGNHVAAGVSQRFDFSDRKAAVLQPCAGILQRIMEIILQRGCPRGRSKYSGVHPVYFRLTGF